MKQNTAMLSQQLALDIGLTPSPSLDNFYAQENEQAWQHLNETMEQILQNPPTHRGNSDSQAPTYLWGDTATGKTHLLRAIANTLEQNGLRYGWMDVDSHPQAFDEQWSALLFDDAHLYSAVQQEQAFNWFVNATHPSLGGQRWVLAAAAIPVTDLPIREDLRTRLGWGITWQLHVLDEVARKSILQKQARYRGLELSDEVANYLLTHFARDLRSLSSLLAQLDTYALQKQRNITVPLLRAMLSETSKNHNLSHHKLV